MKIGWVGLGKLGGPIARMLAQRDGVEVNGFDTNGRMVGWPLNICGTVERVAEGSDLIFVAVPTPHGPEYEGVTRLPESRSDFDYAALIDTLKLLDEAAEQAGRQLPVAVISTVLPGTYRQTLAPFTRHLAYAYTPSFVGMGSVVEDFLNPEFVLIGTPDRAVPEELAVLLATIWQPDPSPPVVATDVTTAEAIKVAYNTFVTTKITLANVWGELADRLGIDADEITDALSMATRRIVSPAYLRAGMGDGGPCHPRDNIALSWLARELNLSFDFFGALMEAREAHAVWLASMIPGGAVLFGRSFKPEVEIIDGSAALLLGNLLSEAGKSWSWGDKPEDAGDVNVIVTAHERYRAIRWPVGSSVIDPFGIIADQEGVTVRRIGRR